MLCRLCFEDSLEVLETEGKKVIADILEKHFKFNLVPNESKSKVLCVYCWTKLVEFDKFYEKIKQLHEEKLQAINVTFFENDETEFKIKIDVENCEELLENNTDDCYVLLDEIGLIESDESVEYIAKDNEVEKIEHEIVAQESAAHKPKRLSEFVEKRKRKRTIDKANEDDKIVSKHIRLICEICNFRAEQYTQMVKHFANDHENTRPFVVCCGRRLNKRERLVQHAWLHEDPEHFQCEICKRVFRDNDIKRAHMKAQHPTEDELVHSCDQCEKRFARIYLLKLHKAVHVPVEERNFHCDKCSTPKAFASQNQLNIHNSMVHHNRQPNICDVCGKTIRDRQAFKKHVRSHFEENGPRVKCPEPGCDSWLKDQDNLKQHLRRHKNSDVVLQCDQCDKTCKDRRALTCHKRSVHPAVLLSCEVCGKLFKKALSLKEHHATHTGEALYECTFCTQKFKSNANMHSHRKKVHPEEWARCKTLKNR